MKHRVVEAWFSNIAAAIDLLIAADRDGKLTVAQVRAAVAELIQETERGCFLAVAAANLAAFDAAREVLHQLKAVEADLGIRHTGWRPRPGGRRLARVEGTASPIIVKGTSLGESTL